MTSETNIQAQGPEVAAWALRQTRNVRNGRQKGLLEWAVNTFGEEANDPRMRAVRFLEEALELFQAIYGGAGQSLAEELLKYVYGRPVGEIAQEIGGVTVTLAMLAASLDASVDELELREIERVLHKDRANLRAKEADKKAAGLNPN